MRFLGKRAARRGAVALRFGDYAASAKLPTPPASFGHYAVGDWGVFANDRCGDCVWAGAAHETMLWTHRSGAGKSARFDDDAVLAAYSSATGYDPAKPATDQGTDMSAAAARRRRTGVLDAAGVAHKIESYLALHPGDVDQLATATYLFGATGIGLQLPTSAEEQFDDEQPWDVVPGSRNAGGHYVSCVGRNSAGNFLVVSWGKIQAMTPRFLQTYCDESLAYLTTENLKDGTSPEGFALTRLRDDLSQITGESA